MTSLPAKLPAFKAYDVRGPVPAQLHIDMVHAIGREDLLQKYPDRSARVDAYDALAIDLAQAFATQDRAYWMPRLEAQDVPFAPERRLQDLAEDPQVQHLGLFYETIHPQHGVVKAAHRPVRYDGDNRSDFLPPPSLGEHTHEVLHGLGITEDEISKLSQQGVI